LLEWFFETLESKVNVIRSWLLLCQSLHAAETSLLPLA
jgi:hypothetical protein